MESLSLKIMRTFFLILSSFWSKFSDKIFYHHRKKSYSEIFRDPKKFILLFIVLQNNSNTCAEAWIHGGGSGVFKIVSGTAVPVPKYIVNLGAICIFMFFFKNSSARTHRRIRKQLVTLRFSTRVQSCPLDGTF